jgi:hypothetical protein
LEYGENLAWNSIEPVDCRVAIELWYDEWKIYNFAKPNVTSQNGHFTQLVSTVIVKNLFFNENLGIR